MTHCNLTRILSDIDVYPCIRTCMLALQIPLSHLPYTDDIFFIFDILVTTVNNMFIALALYTRGMWFPFMPSFQTPSATDPIFTIFIDIFSSSKYPSSASEYRCPPYTMSTWHSWFSLSLLKYRQSYYTVFIDILVTTTEPSLRASGFRVFPLS